MSRFQRTVLLIVSLLGALLTPLTVAAPANAQVGSGQVWRCHDWRSDAYNMSDYQKEIYDCVWGVIYIYDTRYFNLQYKLEGNESHYARKAGRTHEWIRGNCKVGSMSYACSQYRR
jgi:hypothetical protein